MSQLDIDSFLTLVRGKDSNQLGPSFPMVNRLSMYDMLRAFDQMGADDRTRFSQAAFEGIPAQGCGLSRPLPQANQVFIDRIKFAFDVVTKRLVPRQVPGDLYATGQVRDAYAYLGALSSSLSVWATCIGSVCESANLRKKGDNDVIMGGDQTYGQAGWDVGIMYGTGQFGVLPQKITSSCNGSLVKKLGLNAHGDPGEFAVNGVDEQARAIPPTFSASNPSILDTTFGDFFKYVNNVTVEDGALLLHGCSAGKGEGGNTLLKQLSLRVRPRKVIGFTTVGFQSVEKQKRDGEQCREPGVRDTNDFYPDPSQEYNRYFKGGDWDDLSRLPWQSANSPHAKVAQNGVIIKYPHNDASE
jgi:hypothetical protein